MSFNLFAYLKAVTGHIFWSGVNSSAKVQPAQTTGKRCSLLTWMWSSEGSIFSLCHSKTEEHQDARHNPSTGPQ